jgi:16S rRNA (cytidine1402-2'-O)-methyltransferase
MKGRVRKQSETKPAGAQKQSARESAAPKPRAGIEASLRGALTLVATPIGHASDISLRALDAFRAADIIFCEDTRVTQRLLMLHGIGGKKLIAAHEHNERLRAEAILQRVRAGELVVYSSDAGLPCVSDPGQIIVQHLLQHGVEVKSIPGANAALTALQISGLPSDAFYFAGFLPSKSKARRDMLLELKSLRATLLFHESPHRVIDSLEDMRSILGNRPAAMARELTKMHEEIRRGSIADLQKILGAKESIKGEIVLVIGAFSDLEEEMMDQAEIDRLLLEARKTLSAREAAAIMSTKTGLPKRELYQRLLHLNDRKKSP